METWNQFQVLLEKEAALQPDSPAIIDRRCSLTFLELATSVRYRCRELSIKSQGLPAGNFIAVLADRTVDTVVTMLACLAGKIPFGLVNPHASASRQLLLWEKLGKFPLVIASSDYVDSEGVFPEAGLFRPVLSFSETPWKTCTENGSQQALCLFTSGSTGEPKGAIWSYDTVLYRLGLAANRITLVNGEARIPNLNPLYWVTGFNAATMAMFGATVTLIDPLENDISTLVLEIAQSDPTQITLGPHMAKSVSAEVAGKGLVFPNIARVYTGGDICRFEYFAGLRGAVCPETELVHLYGSTEAPEAFPFTTTFDQMPTHGQIPLRGASDCQHFRLEPFAHDRFVLWRSGWILSEYLDDPSLNESCFRTDAQGVRWWISEDVFRQSGNHLIFDSRTGDWCEVGGEMVSFAAIQECVNRHPNVQQAVVVRHSCGTENALGIHVEKRPHTLVSLESLQAFMKPFFPANLTIAEVIVHASLPTSERGKIDREALRNLGVMKLPRE